MTTPIPPLEKPTSDDVAAILRARTKDLNGTELGVFNENTRPTDTEVARIIDMAYDEVTGRVGTYLGSACAQSARMLVVIRAAAWVELSYWPEQVRSDRSVYAELIDQWEPAVQAVIDCVSGNAPVDGGGEDTKAGYRFGVLDIHGWTASPYYGAPDIGAADLITGTVGPPGPAGPAGAAGPPGPPGPAIDLGTGEFTFNTSTTTPPADGQVRLNTADMTAATHVYLSNLTVDGVDISRGVQSGVVNRIDIQDKDDATRWVHYTVAVGPGHVAGFTDYAVTYVSGGTALAAQRVMVTIYRELT